MRKIRHHTPNAGQISVGVGLGQRLNLIEMRIRVSP